MNNYEFNKIRKELIILLVHMTSMVTSMVIFTVIIFSSDTTTNITIGGLGYIISYIGFNYFVRKHKVVSKHLKDELDRRKKELNDINKKD